MYLLTFAASAAAAAKFFQTNRLKIPASLGSGPKPLYASMLPLKLPKQQTHKHVHMKSPSLSARSYIFRPQLAKRIQESRTCASCRGKHLTKKRTLEKESELCAFDYFLETKQCTTSVRSFLRRYRAEISAMCQKMKVCGLGKNPDFEPPR